jgi:uncharacterized membrane protein required for colicin V production
MLYSPSIALAIWALFVARFGDALAVAVIGGLATILAVAVHVAEKIREHRD